MSYDDFKPAVDESGRFDDDRAKARPASFKNLPRITRASSLMGGGIGSGSGAYEETVGYMSKEDLADLEFDMMTDGLDRLDYSSSHQMGFADYSRRHASSRERDIVYDDHDLNEQLDPDDELDHDLQRVSFESLDSTDEGPGLGHSPIDSPEVGPIHEIPAGNLPRFSFKSRVHIASLDCLATVYDQAGSTITVKTADGEFIEVQARDCRPIQAGRASEQRQRLVEQPRRRAGTSTNFTAPYVQRSVPGQDQSGSEDDAFDNMENPVKYRNDYQPNSRTNDQTMSAFSSTDQQLSGSERRARRRRLGFAEE